MKIVSKIQLVNSSPKLTIIPSSSLSNTMAEPMKLCFSLRKIQDNIFLDSLSKQKLAGLTSDISSKMSATTIAGFFSQIFIFYQLLISYSFFHRVAFLPGPYFELD